MKSIVIPPRYPRLPSDQSDNYWRNRNGSSRSSSGRDKKKPSQKGRKIQRVRGKEVTVRQSASDGQIIFGRMKVGGVLTFIETSKNSKAFLVTGSGNYQLLWTARTSGAAGNDVTIELEVTGTTGSVTVTVTGNAIKVRGRSSSGVSLSTASEIRTAVRANASAMALVSIDLPQGSDGTDVIDVVSPTNLREGGGTWLHNVVTWAAHQVDAIETIWLDNREVTFGHASDARWGTGVYSKRVFHEYRLGSPSQEAIPDLIAQLPALWTTDHKQSGCCHSYLILVWDGLSFPEGYPEIAATIRGVLCYDPRTTGTAWTRNAALIAAFYLMNDKFGLNVPLADIDTTSWIDSANCCDETITIPGGSEPRYCVDGVIDTSRPPQDVLSELAAAMAGDIVYQGGKWYILAGKYRTPTVTLTDDDLRSDLQITTKRSLRDAFNCVRATYPSKDHNYEEVDAPVVKNSTYITEDGGVEKYEDLVFSLVTSGYQAQRLMKIALEKNRQGISVRCTVSLKGLLLQVGDVVNLTLDRYGWSAKPFEVRNLSIIVDPREGAFVDLELDETASAVYDWNNGEETTIDVAANTNLPSPFTVGAITSLVLTSGTAELYIRLDGTVWSRIKATWTVDDELVTNGGDIELQYKPSASSDWLPGPIVGGDISTAYLTDVQDGVAYDVRARAINALGTKGEWTTETSHVVVGKTAPPSNVSGFAGSANQFGIELTWTEVNDLDIAYYEIRQGASWATATLIGQIRGSSFAIQTKTAGSYTFLIKAVDTSGNYSTTATSAVVVVAAPSAPTVSSSFDGSNVNLSWTAPSSNHSIDSYVIKYGATLGGATEVTKTKSLALKVLASWSGTRRYWVEAIDVAGNLGSAGFVDVVVTAPGVVNNKRAEIVDNNVLLYWTAPSSGSLPIAKYRVYKGASFGGATLVGEVSGTFAALFETSAGTVTYWVVAVDSAGNAGTESSIVAAVAAPPDFVLFFSNDFTLSSGTLTNAAVDGTSLVFPVVSETYEDHFLDNGWTTPQDQIDDNYPLFIEPAAASATMVYTYDYGALFTDSTLVTASWSESAIEGSVTVDCMLSFSTDNVSWTDYASTTAIYVSNFRYVKITLTATAADTRSLKRLQNLNVRAAAKKKSDMGVVTANSGDSGGTTVTLNESFVDVESIVLTPKYNASYPVIAVYDFTDAPNPTTFKVLCYRSDTGARVTNEVRWEVRGY